MLIWIMLSTLLIQEAINFLVVNTSVMQGAAQSTGARNFRFGIQNQVPDIR